MKNTQYYAILGTIWMAPYAPNWVNLAAGGLFMCYSLYLGLKGE